MNKPTHEITLEEMRRMSIPDLVRMDMSILKDLQNEAELAATSAIRTKFWIDGAISFKLYEQSKTNVRG